VQLSDFNGFAVVDFAARKEVARVQLPAAKAEFVTDGDRATAAFTRHRRCTRRQDPVGD